MKLLDKSKARLISLSSKHIRSNIPENILFGLRILEDINEKVPDEIKNEKSEERAAALLALLKDGNPEAQLKAIVAIGKLGVKDERFIEPLIKALSDSDPYVRSSAAKTIGEIGIKDERFIEPLIKALSDSNPLVRGSAALAIGEVGVKDERFIELLIKALSDRNPVVRRKALLGIDQLGIKDERFIAPLKKALNSDEISAHFASFAIFTLGFRERVIDLLFKELDDRHPLVRSNAALAVGNLMARDARFIAPLLKMLNDLYPSARKNAVFALGKIGDLSVLPALEKKLVDPNKDVRKEAEKAIRKIRK